MATDSDSFRVDEFAVSAFYRERRWTDGLALAPATRNVVDSWLDELDARELAKVAIGDFAPSFRGATVEAVVVNTIMAGGEPWQVPVVIAALEAMLEPQFNLASVQATTHPCSPLIVLDHPGGDERFRTRTGALGPGDNATAAIGRSVRLCMQNIGGAIVGSVDRATQGSPAKFSYCVFTSRDDFPAEWASESTHRSSDSVPTVHVYATEGAHNVHDATSKSAFGILNVIADVLVTLGGNDQYFPFGCHPIFLCPEHARAIAEDGFSARDVQSTLYELARLPHDQIALGGRFNGRLWEPWRQALYDSGRTVPITSGPEAFHLYIVGGPGYHSAVNPGFGLSRHAFARLGSNVRETLEMRHNGDSVDDKKEESR